MMFRRSCAFVLCAAGFISCLAQAPAQTAPSPQPPLPPISVSPLSRTTEPEAPRILPPAALPQGELAPPSDDDTPQDLTAVEIDGATVYPANEVQALFAGMAPGTTTRAKISNAVRTLQLKYRADGYFLTKVTGSVEKSVLKVRVIEGYISDVKMANEIGPAGTLVYNFLNKLAGIRPIRIADLERYVLLAQNIPGITVHTTLRPAKDEPGAVELIAQVDRKSFSASFEDDNRGPQTVGPNEVLLSAALNSFTNLGDRTELVFFNTPVDSEEVFGQLSEEFYVGSEGLKLRGYVGFGALQPGRELRAEGYLSRILVAGMGAEYPFIRTRALTIFGSAALDFEDTIIDLHGAHPSSDSYLRILRIGGRAEAQDTFFGADLPGADVADFKVHRGLPGFLGGTENGDPFPARPNERNDFTKVTMELRRTQDLYHWDVSSLALFLAVEGQYTNDLLPPTEKLFLGGSEYGRGYYNGEVTGDTAVAGTVELQLNDRFTAAAFGHGADIAAQYYAFYDLGQAWEDPEATQPFERLTSVGVGIRTRISDHISLQLEGVERITRNPTRASGIEHLDPEQAIYFRVSGQI